MYEDLLIQVNKPGRYIGHEWNISRKVFEKANIKFGLIFPDLYEVGMSNLGVRIIYGILNNIDDVCCERFFSCEMDMIEVLRKNNLRPLSLESKKSLSDFDMLGFSLGSELCYTNVLNILDSGGIPLKASMRDNQYPLVIGGGPAALNPEPMHEFFDLFVIGEAEELIVEIIDVYRSNKINYKNGKISKKDLLFALSQLEGVYIPSFYDAVYDKDSNIIDFKTIIDGVPEVINKRIVKDLNLSYYPLSWLIPYIQIIHDRISLEVMRGCPNRCRFCQARSCYFPLRLRHAEVLVNLAKQLYANTGYEEISLCGLSVSDYPHIEELTSRLVELFLEKAISLALPSIKANSNIKDISSAIAAIKKTGLTFAPEAGRANMRNILNKDFNEQEFFSVLKQSYLLGYQRVKLYFMIGLPFERKDDLDAIKSFSNKVSDLRKEIGKQPALVNISINALIPKPHTPFQWLAMDEPQVIKEKQSYLRDNIKNKRLSLNFHDYRMSFIEGVLSRGDRILSKVILSAFKKGVIFDAWSNHFSYEKWVESFSENNINPMFYIKEKPRPSMLPWDFIDTGITKESLLSEFDKVVDV